MAKKKVTKKTPVSKKQENELPDCIIKVSASYPDGKQADYEYVIKNVYQNIPPAKLVRMGKAVLNGLQEIYGMGVKFK